MHAIATVRNKYCLRMYYNIPLSDVTIRLLTRSQTKTTTTIINTIIFDTHLKTAVTEVKNKIKMRSKCPITNLTLI